MPEFKHRTWNHLCWTFESVTGTSKMYLNGEFQGSFKFETEFVKSGVLGTDEVFDSAFIIGQEPDAPSPRGGFEAEQAFVGDLTELNMWDTALDDRTIQLLGTCKDFSKGNIISWDINSFLITKVPVEEIDLEELCTSTEQLLVFPKLMSWRAAWTLCAAHGGTVFTPMNQAENDELMKTLAPHEEKCADPVSGKMAWIGMKSIDYKWYKMDKMNDDSLELLTFTPWELSAPYYANYDCGFTKKSGTWDSDLNCKKKVKLCTVCQVKGL